MMGTLLTKYGDVFTMVMMAGVLWLMYLQDGDWIAALLAALMALIALLRIYFQFFHKPKEAEEEATD
jgi:L-asparagine transporter-like permease